MAIRSRPGFYEFFAGGGLAGLGLETLGLRRLFANDIDPMKAAAFEANHGAGTIHRGDVGALTPADLPGRADLVWASPPCQDVSLAGGRAGLAGARSGAFWGFWRLMCDLAAEGRAPGVIVIENVMGLLSSNGGEDFRAIGRALADGGYVFGALELDAADWLPQSRPRLFVVAARADRPDLTGMGHGQTPRIAAARDALPDDLRAAWRDWRLPAPPRRNADLASVLEADVPWMAAAERDRLLDLLGPLHRRRLEAARAASVRDGVARVAAGYRRARPDGAGGRVQRLELRFDGLAGCLRTAAGGSSRQFIVATEAGAIRARRMTPREAARLMGAPDDWRLPASDTAALKLMGDGVAAPVVAALAEGLIGPLLGRQSSPLPGSRLLSTRSS